MGCTAPRTAARLAWWSRNATTGSCAGTVPSLLSVAPRFELTRHFLFVLFCCCLFPALSVSRALFPMLKQLDMWPVLLPVLADVGGPMLWFVSPLLICFVSASLILLSVLVLLFLPFL